MEYISFCPLCKNDNIAYKISCIDFLVSGKEFSIYQCHNCKFRFTNPRPSVNESEFYYKSDDYISHTESKSGLINKMYFLVRKITLLQKLRLIKKYRVNNRILDIGCGTGAFLNECKKNNMEVSGIEPSELARKIGYEKYDIEIFPDEFFFNCNENYFGIVTMWHVLEHVYDINAYIEKIYRILINNGIFIIALPNPDSYDAKIYEKFWAAYDVPRHLYHFNKDNIITLAKKFNFSLISIIPMKFDSFYISLLSEKNKNGKTNFYRAILNGLKSNLLARKDLNYSSLTYIFQKT